MDSNSSSSSAAPISPLEFDEYNKKLQQAALQATRHALYIPADITFHRSMDAGLSKDLDAFSTRLLSLTNKLLYLTTTIDATSSGKDKGKAKLETQDDVVDNFHSVVVDCMDQLLERTDICLDEYLGRTKPPAIAINPVTQKVAAKKKAPVSTGRLDPALQHASHIAKPQLHFKRKLDNSDSPWYPSLSHKYHAQVPLGYDYRDVQDEDNEVSIQAHPYRYEIVHFKPPTRMFVSETPVSPHSMSKTPFTWVSTPEVFQAMLAKLRQASEIAVDLEHHDYRTHSGFVCLMQLSTRQEDWIVDALALREELVELNEVFTDPGIIKVFHGAESDIIWLQRDFNVYVVNLFDTFHASRLLEFPRHGLANLLEMYCDFIPDKRYQLADWRIRPLPEEMLLYARSDTHFLLYIYDCLRNALLDRSRSQSRSNSRSPSSSSTPTPPSAGPHGLLLAAVSRSRETSLRVYQKDMYDAVTGSGSGGWDMLARKWNKPLLFANNDNSMGKLQRSVYRAVHAWRDSVAREEDESTRYVLPNHYLFRFAEQPPNDMAALLNMFSSGAPPVVRRRAKELLDIVREATKVALTSPLPEKVATPQVEAVQTPIPTESGQNGFAVSQSTSKIDIWASGPNTIVVVKSKQSTLFKSSSSSVSTTTSRSITSSKSSLFGQRDSGTFENGPSSTSRFKELVSRINSTLVIAPSAPKPAAIKSEASKVYVKASTEEEEVTDVLGMQVEVPFVPAAERKPKILDSRVEDTIVVVGQPRARKRKRKERGAVSLDAVDDGMEVEQNEAGLGQNGGPSKGREEFGKERERDDSQDIVMEGADEVLEAQGDFDFSAVPNLLDDDPDNEAEDKQTKQKRHKKQANKGGGMFYGDFPAPPKAHSEFRRGNKSQTFRG
ncbi:hypothetical protein AX17_003695 [Amanita inopinata Kibby_2008]|nr:hypothetical protein AX17_003695 [Amanita inopinata Kibby_2008]